MTTTAVVLCGGLGSRLHPLTESLPKSLLPIGRTTMLDLVIRGLARSGVVEIVLCAGYGAASIAAHLRTGAARADAHGSAFTYSCAGWECRVTVIDTGLDVATGERLYRIRDRVGTSDLVVAYADLVADVDVVSLLAEHRRSNAQATVTVARARSPFGHVDIDDAGRVRSLREKPLLAEWINIGYMVLNGHVLQGLNSRSGPLEHDVLPRMAATHELRAHRHQGPFESIDTPADHRRVDSLLRGSPPPWLRRIETGCSR
ncbi:nucleotidyltransferase family protein [Actinomycetospora sp. CA-101289]|uniref:nucleotidyltransferase family protein n=1 Tax=Actinomycetospora sp. CA-101289 TaxID=3239893 RepID=UPI003D97AF8B